MTGSENNIEGSEVARALEDDQHEQRLEQEKAMRREEELSERLAAQLADRPSDAEAP